MSNTRGFTSIPCAQGLPPARLDENTRWTSLLQKNLGGDYRVFEAGLGGRTTVYDDPTQYGRNGYPHLEVIFESCSPCDLAIVMLGTNDVRFVPDAILVGMGMRRLLVLLKEVIARSFNPGCQILVVAPPKVLTGLAHVPPGFGYKPEWADEIAKLPGIYEGICREVGVHFANGFEWADPDFSDGIHLGPEGHAIFAEKLAEIAKNLIG